MMAVGIGSITAASVSLSSLHLRKAYHLLAIAIFTPVRCLNTTRSQLPCYAVSCFGLALTSASLFALVLSRTSTRLPFSLPFALQLLLFARDFLFFSFAFAFVLFAIGEFIRAGRVSPFSKPRTYRVGGGEEEGHRGHRGHREREREKEREGVEREVEKGRERSRERWRGRERGRERSREREAERERHPHPNPPTHTHTCTRMHTCVFLYLRCFHFSERDDAALCGCARWRHHSLDAKLPTAWHGHSCVASVQRRHGRVPVVMLCRDSFCWCG